jgi:hypothetical protein
MQILSWAYATLDKKVVVVLMAGWHEAGNVILCSLSVALLLSLLPLPNVCGLLLLFALFLMFVVAAPCFLSSSRLVGLLVPLLDIFTLICGPYY